MCTVREKYSRTTPRFCPEPMTVLFAREDRLEEEQVGGSWGWLGRYQ